MSSNDPADDRRPTPWRRPLTLAWAATVVIAVFYLLREHWGHVLGWWPYLVLMLCPLMHLFHGHGRHHRKHGASAEKPGER
jgi:hypothetical protein